MTKLRVHATFQYYHFDPGMMSIADVLDRWMKSGDKTYDDVFWLSPDDVWPYREYTWSRGHSRHDAAYWDSLVASLSSGWDATNSLKLIFGKNGQVKVGEGNHRLAISREIGLNLIPVEFLFYQVVDSER